MPRRLTKLSGTDKEDLERFLAKYKELTPEERVLRVLGPNCPGCKQHQGQI